MSGWGWTSPSPGYAATGEDEECSFPGTGVCPEAGTVRPQLASCLSIGAYALLTSLLRLLKKVSLWTDFYISWFMGWVPQALKLSGKTENIWCEHYINTCKHTVNLMHLEHKEFILFLISGIAFAQSRCFIGLKSWITQQQSSACLQVGSTTWFRLFKAAVARATSRAGIWQSCQVSPRSNLAN